MSGAQARGSAARTDDDLGTRRSRSPDTAEQRAWVRKALGVDVDALDALDLRTTTTQASADQAVPLLLRQVTEIGAPLASLPPAQTPQLAAADLSLHNLRTELGGKPSPQAVAALRREVDALPGLVDAAVLSVTRLRERQRGLVEEAGALTCPENPSEAGLVQEFKTRQAAVAEAFDGGPLSDKQVEAAETALQAAKLAMEQVVKAVQERLGRRLAELVQQVGTLTYSSDADGTAESEQIGRFGKQRDAVAAAQSKAPLTDTDIEQAEESLRQAGDTAKEIDKAVEQRHEAWARSIRTRADKLMGDMDTDDVAPALWATPKDTRERINKELVPS